MTKTTEQPAQKHGAIEEILPDVFFVQGQIRMPMPLPLPMVHTRAMTIVRDGKALTLVNSIQLDEEGLASLEALGSVTNVLRIGGFHGRDDLFYKQRYKATVYAIDGHIYRRGLPPMVSKKDYLTPDVLLDEDSNVPIDGASLHIFRSSDPIEALLLLERHGGIAISADALQNTAERDEYMNWLGAFIGNKMGFFKAHNVGPGWLKFAKPTLEDVRSILELRFEHLFPGHGTPVLHDALEKFRPALEGTLKGARV